MSLFPFFRKKDFFSDEEKQRVLEAIQLAEKQTSGEVRLYVESRCKYVNALDRAAEIFWSLKMDQTKDRNGVLVYVALKDHQFAIFADQGIHEKVGEPFWKQEVGMMKKHFSEMRHIDAIVEVIHDIGKALQSYFPYDEVNDKNELPDDIVFGK